MAELKDFRLWFNKTDREAGMVMVSGQYESHAIELLKRFIIPSMKCIDARAYIRFDAYLMASLVRQIWKRYRHLSLYCSL